MSDYAGIPEASTASGDIKAGSGEGTTKSNDTKTNLQKEISSLNSNSKKEVDDEVFVASSPKDKHETAYTTILDAYAENIKETLKNKRAYKSQVFQLAFDILAIMSFLPAILLIIAIFWRPSNLEEWYPVVVPALVSFLTVFIVIPRVITKYLFNLEEEKYMSEIIKNIQNYDKENHT